MARTRSLAAAAVVLVTAGLAACAPGHAAAQDACQAYANTNRRSVAKTFAETEAVRARAQSEAAQAASADARWQALQNDIRDAYSHLNKMALNNGEADAYFTADRRVQADCTAAGADIGDLGH